MEQILNTSWFLLNITTLWIGLKSKLLILLQIRFQFLNVEELRYIALVIGIISSIIFIGYNISKWYDQILKTKVLRKKEGIEKLFTFVDNIEDLEKKLKEENNETKNLE
jgi:hypothetical protein